MSSAALALPEDHPAYAGHFPAHPILPAVVLLAEVMAHLAADTRTTAADWSLQQAKFVRSVAPGEALAITCEADAGGGRRFAVMCGEALVATGRFARAMP